MHNAAITITAVCTSLLMTAVIPTAATDDCNTSTTCQDWIYPERIYIILCTSLGGVVLCTSVVGCVAVAKYTQLSRLVNAQRQNGTGSDPENAAPAQPDSVGSRGTQKAKRRRNKSAKASARSTQSSSSGVGSVAASFSGYELATAPSGGGERFQLTTSPARGYQDPYTEYQDPLDVSGTFPSTRASASASGSSLLGGKKDRANTSSSSVASKAAVSSGAYELATAPNIGQAGGERFRLTSSPVHGNQIPSTEYQDPLDMSGQYPSQQRSPSSASANNGARQDSYANVDLRRKSVSKKDRASALPSCEEAEETPVVPVKSSDRAILSIDEQDAPSVSDQPGASYSQVELKRKPQNTKTPGKDSEDADEEAPQIPKKMDDIQEQAEQSATRVSASPPQDAASTFEQGASILQSHVNASTVHDDPQTREYVTEDAVQETSFMREYEG